jgi:hypothetical protein
MKMRVTLLVVLRNGIGACMVMRLDAWSYGSCMFVQKGLLSRRLRLLLQLLATIRTIEQVLDWPRVVHLTCEMSKHTDSTDYRRD